MCELFLAKGNRYGHLFKKEALESARNLNPDGAGFVIFKPNSNGKYEVKDMGKFPAKYYWTRRTRTKRTALKTNPSAPVLNPARALEIPAPRVIPRTVGEVIDSTLKEEQSIEKREEAYWANRFLEAEALGEEAVQEVYDAMALSYEHAKWDENFEKKDNIIVPKNRNTENLFDSVSKKIEGFTFTRTTSETATTVEVEDEVDEFAYSSMYEDDCVEQLMEVQEGLKADELLVAHFRYGTTGDIIEENTHPVANNKYLVLHNGVFRYHSLPKGYNDTRHFTEIIDRKARKIHLSSAQHLKEEKMLKKALEEAGGYHSVFIYSFITKELYYFKSKGASFFWDSSGLLGATKETRFPHTVFEAKDIILRPEMQPAV